ncbi:MAG: heme-binding domain-containing protein [Ferruginibacter sp.]
MKKILKVLAIILLIAFIIIQFIRPSKNAGEEISTNQISAAQIVPDDISNLLKTSCYDCHSNTTVYPWYANIQPAAWFLNDHIVDGKKELNFSQFASYPPYRRYKKFKEIQKQIKEDEMPLFSYTLLHRDAVLTADQKTALINWAGTNMKEMEAKYPADSLIRPKK